MVRRALALLFWLLPALAAAQGEARLEIVPDDRAAPPIVGEMVLVTVRGTYDLTVLLDEFVVPETGAFAWVQLDRDSWSRRQVGGRTFLTVERRLAIFPKEEGPLDFGPVMHRLTVALPGGGREVREVMAEPLRLEVRPYPAVRGGGTLSASAFVLTDTLSTDPGKLRDGESLVRTVVVEALGTMPQMLPQRPVIVEPWLITFSAPEERRFTITPDGPLTTVVWRWHLRPRTGEPGVLPQIPIRWYDTGARRMSETMIPAIPFGYASFEIEARGGVEFGLPAMLSLCAASGTGLALGLFVLLGGYRPGVSFRFRSPIRRWRRWNAVRRLRRAARAGDEAGLRAALAASLREGETGSPEFRACRERLERMLYAPG